MFLHPFCLQDQEEKKGERKKEGRRGGKKDITFANFTSTK